MVRLLIFRFLESYFRHRWLYLLPLIIMIGAAGVFFALSKPKYVARGSIYVQTDSFLSTLNSVNTSDTSWWATPAQAVTSDINELLTTDAFIRAVIHNTDLEERMDQGSQVVGETITDVRESIWIATLGDNQIQINASNEDAQIAYQITNSVLDTFVQWQVNAERTEGEAAQTFFADLISVYEANLEVARGNLMNYLLEHPVPLRGNRSEIEVMEIDRLQGEIEIAGQRYINAIEKEENARLALAQIEGDARQSYTIIDAPVLPEKPEVSRKEMAIQLAIFLIAGGILSAAAVVGSMLMDRSIRFPFDVQYGMHLPVLAMVPVIPGKSSRKDGEKQRKQETEEIEQPGITAAGQPQADELEQELAPEPQPARKSRRGKRKEALASPAGINNIPEPTSNGNGADETVGADESKVETDVSY